MKTIKELLIMLKNEYQKNIKKDYFIKGLCGNIYLLNSKKEINIEEMYILLDYLNDNKPWYTIFTTLYNKGYWWNTDNTKVRIKWLEKHIKKFK